MSSEINELILRDVRCFKGEHRFAIKPITFLVGENSTGKSTVLGCLSAFGHAFSIRERFEINFDAEPYHLGTFTNIARQGAKYFDVGCQFKASSPLDVTFRLVALDKGAEPVVGAIILTLKSGKIWLLLSKKYIPSDKKLGKKWKRKSEFIFGDYYLQASADKNELFIFPQEETPFFDLEDIYYILQKKYFFRKNSEDSKASKDLTNFPMLRELESLDKLFQGFIDIFNIAPVRSKPKRTYDPIKATSTSEGQDIPTRFNYLKRNSEESWELLKKLLARFGKDSGMFTDVDVRTLGESVSDPFQLQINVRGEERNIMDVGYGVSQILPVLVEVFTKKKQLLLIQQPEIHLHPKSQAALASLLIARTTRKNFVIETHSNYMIDRTRIEIRRGKIKPEDVSLIFLEPKKGDNIKVHNISFDKQGNMQDVPKSYGDFFIDETHRLLGLEG